MKTLAALLPLLLLSACDPFGLPENPSDTAAYYVATGQIEDRQATRVAITYQTPDGVRQDTLIASDTLVIAAPRTRALASWSRVFQRDDLPTFSITATNLTLPNATGNVGFVSVSLLVNQETVAFDTSRTEVTLSY